MIYSKTLKTCVSPNNLASSHVTDDSNKLYKSLDECLHAALQAEENLKLASLKHKKKGNKRQKLNDLVPITFASVQLSSELVKTAKCLLDTGSSRTLVTKQFLLDANVQKQKETKKFMTVAGISTSSESTLL